MDRTYRLDSPPIVQGLSIPFACIGSGDPVRVLRLYTTNTLDIFEAFIAEAYVQLVATDSTVLCSSLTLWDFLLLLLLPRVYASVSLCLYCVCLSVCVRRTVLCGALYTACVDASRTVFWDRSSLNGFFQGKIKTRSLTWGADLTSGVEVCEAHALCRHPVEIRRLLCRVSVDAQITPAHLQTPTCW